MKQSNPLGPASAVALFALAGCAGFTVETSSYRSSEPTAAPPPAAAVAPAEAEAEVTEPAPRPKVDFIASNRDERIARLEKRDRYTTNLFADVLLARELEAAPEEEKAAAIDAVRAAIETAAKKDAAEHEGWAKTTVAPKAAADAAMESLRGEPNFRDAARDIELLRVQVVDADWKIEKNKGGYPLAKFKFVRIVGKRKGVDACVAFYGTINHAHEGGGRYAQGYGSVPNSQWSGVKCPAGIK
jgi:hypothetical protein